MQYRKRNRFLGICAVLLCCSIGAYLILSNLRDNIVYFYPPSEVSQMDVAHMTKLRLGGIVKPDSVRSLGQKKIEFVITDHTQDIKVYFKGDLPALFREGQGIIAEGTLSLAQEFNATSLLTKHDETYKPPSK